MSWGQGVATRLRISGPETAEPQAHHWDTPPKDIRRCRGRSPGSRVVTSVRPSQGSLPSDTDGPRLAAYSCGGSAGLVSILGRSIRTGFPLSSGAYPENHDRAMLWATAHHVHRLRSITAWPRRTRRASGRSPNIIQRRTGDLKIELTNPETLSRYMPTSRSLPLHLVACKAKREPGRPEMAKPGLPPQL
jgi:hypothetical protein